MVIGITGYGCTGASAVIDLIKEFDDVQSFTSSVEFQLLQQPDGIMDLYYALVESGRRLGISTAVSRFHANIKNPSTLQIRKATCNQYQILTEQYIDSLTQIQWKGRSAFDPVSERFVYDTLSLRKINKVINLALRKVFKDAYWPTKRVRYFSMLSKDYFIQETKTYIRRILESAHFDLSKPIILEQLFNTTYPVAGMEFIDDALSIVVDRDPRDVFVLMNFYYGGAIGTSFMPDTGDVEQFIIYYKGLHQHVSSDPRVIYIQFEDLIYNYEMACQKIERIMDGYAHSKKGEFFKPQCSINNTMVYKLYPQYADKIKRIEDELTEYLYPFEKMQANITFKREKLKPFDRQVTVNSRLLSKTFKGSKG